MTCARLVLLSVVLCTPVVVTAQNPVVKNAWVKMPAAGETSARVYADIENRGMYGFYLVSGSTEIGGVELRSAAPEDKVVADINVDAYATLSMNPKGFYLRLVDLKRPLKVGETIAITLLTDSNLGIQVPAVVRAE